MKTCYKCQLTLSFNKFNKNKQHKDGLASMCKDCNIEYCKQWVIKNKNYHLQKQKEYRENNPEKVSETKKQWYKNNLEHCSKRASKYYENNAEAIKDKVKAYRLADLEADNLRARQYYQENKLRCKNTMKKWRAENPGKLNALGAKRRKSVIRATPNWLTDTHYKEIEEFYIEARDLRWLNEGELLHVDHIVPLQGKNVCGLHVPWNLQVIPASVNLKKSNKLL